VGWWSDTLQWVRPLHKPTNHNTEKSAGTTHKDLEFHCRPFYKTVQEKFATVSRSSDVLVYQFKLFSPEEVIFYRPGAVIRRNRTQAEFF
jgi:hypothetical protein